MIRREKVQALVLSRRPLGEADRLLQLFTEEHGLVSVVAKGVRRIPSRRGGYLEPLTHIMALISGGDRYYLAAVEPMDDFLPLRQDEVARTQAMGLAHLVRHLFRPEEPQPSVFAALSDAFATLPELPLAKRYVLECAVALHALTCAGILPQLKSCHVCGTLQTQEAVLLDAAAGGWRCLSCHNSFAGTRVSLPPRLLIALRWLAQHAEQALRLRLTEEESQQLVTAMRHYVAQVVETPLSYDRA
jgi:DNA repair protein RecO (recombination protein O)